MKLDVEVHLSVQQIIQAYIELGFWERQEVWQEISKDPPEDFKCDECGRTELAEDGKTCRACRDFHCAGIPRPPFPVDRIACIKEVKLRTGASLKMTQHRLELCHWDVEETVNRLHKSLAKG